MKRLVLIVFSACLLIFTLSGCRSHVDTSSKEISDCDMLTFEGASFQLPFEMEDGIDYTTLTNVMYDTLAEKEAARNQLVRGAIKGQTADGYLFADSLNYLFYVGKCNSAVSVESASRDTLISACSRTDITWLHYGRCIANGNKAVMHVRFSVNNTLNERINYEGYLGVAKLGDTAYFYLAGCTQNYNILKTCFDCARSLE